MPSAQSAGRRALPRVRSRAVHLRPWEKRPGVELPGRRRLLSGCQPGVVVPGVAVVRVCVWAFVPEGPVLCGEGEVLPGEGVLDGSERARTQADDFGHQTVT